MITHPRLFKWLLGLLAGSLAGTAVAVLFWFDPSRHGFYPVCYFHLITGWQCPGCGGLRATHQLLHGHVAAAFRFNPLLVAALPLAAAGTVRVLFCQLRGRPIRLELPGRWLWWALGVALAFGVLRNLPWLRL